MINQEDSKTFHTWTMLSLIYKFYNFQFMQFANLKEAVNLLLIFKVFTLRPPVKHLAFYFIKIK